MNKESDLHLTLDELEGEVWGESPYDSHLVTECHRLRRVPLIQFTIENLRIMIGQKISLRYLVPLALDRLEENPFAEGDFYAGDLLLSVLRVNSEFWKEHSDLFWRLNGVMSGVESRSEFLVQEVLPAWSLIR